MTDVPALSSEVEAFLRYQAYSHATFPAIAAEAHRRFGTEAPSPAVVATYICERLRGTRTLLRFKRDIAVAMWLAEEGWTATLDDTRARCARRFGAARTPSRSALARFLKGLGRTGAVVSRAIPADVFAYAAKHAPDLHLSDLTRITRKRFGPARAPSRSRLHRQLRQHRISTAGLRGRVEQDDELATWFRAAAGTMDLDALRGGCPVRRRARAEPFGDTPIPEAGGHIPALPGLSARSRRVAPAPPQ
jgi:hypothetical protein